jgi:hypothetical protein
LHVYHEKGGLDSFSCSHVEVCAGLLRVFEGKENMNQIRQSEREITIASDCVDNIFDGQNIRSATHHSTYRSGRSSGGQLLSRALKGGSSAKPSLFLPPQGSGPNTFQ